jgi:mono/diheme cytochrome c family protein
MTKRTKRKIRIAAVALVLLAIATGFTAWYKIRRDVAQPQWITSDARNDYLYGSVGAESTAGIPYWIWLALPRLFPDYLHYPGGYVALGLSWEESREMPVGFSKKTVGYVRVAGNCALCHARSYRTGPDETSAVVDAVRGRATDIKPLLLFFHQCAADPRFNAGELLSEIGMATGLSFLDQSIYRFALIPRTRQAMLNQESVIVDPDLQYHSRNPYAPFSSPRMKALEVRIRDAQAPAYPLPVNPALVAAGKPLFAQHCGSCHALDGQSKVIPIGEIGTDHEHLENWTQAAHADGASDRLGRERIEMVKNSGYLAGPLNGIWLRGPYLHNGSVPTVRALLQPQAQRPRTFYRGNDLIDATGVGFLSTEAEERGRRQFVFFDASQRGNGNAGHLYGIGLSSSEKDALLEYLKTL